MKDGGWTVTGLEPDQRAREKAMENHQVELLFAMELFQLPEIHLTPFFRMCWSMCTMFTFLSQLKKLVRQRKNFHCFYHYRSYDASVYQEYGRLTTSPGILPFSPMAMKRLFARRSRLHALKGMWFDSFYISLLSEKYKTGHSDFSGTIYRDVSNLKAWIDRETCSSLIYVIEKQNLVRDQLSLFDGQVYTYSFCTSPAGQRLNLIS